MNLVGDRGFDEVLSAAQNLLSLGEDRNERGRERERIFGREQPQRAGREQPQRREQRPEWREQPILRPFDGYDEFRNAGGDPVAPGGRTAFRKPHMIPDKYDGEKSWVDYKNHFEAVSKINGWSGAEKAQFLVASLRGQAQKVLADMPEESRDYAEVIRVMNLRFGPQQRPELYFAELRAKTRGSNESLRELGQSIRRLTTLAYPDMSMDQRDMLAKTHFADAVGDQDIRMRLFQVKPETLQDAILVALEVEAFRRVEAQRNGAALNKSRQM